MLEGVSQNSSFESINESSSEILHYFPAIIVPEELQNVPIENPVSILTAIAGRWKPVSSENLQEFLTDIRATQMEQLYWEHAEPEYELFREDVICQHSWLLGKAIKHVFMQIFKEQKPIKSCGLNEFVDEARNCLVSARVSFKGVEEWRLERAVKNGKLEITHTRGSMWCKRVYEKVSD